VYDGAFGSAGDGHGIYVSAALCCIRGARITNNAVTGIYATTTSKDVDEDYNCFFNNGSTGSVHQTNVDGWTDGATPPAGSHDVIAASYTEEGYTDVQQVFSWDGGDGNTIAVGENVVDHTDGTTIRGVVTAQTGGAAATGTCTIKWMRNGVIANNQALLGFTSGKHFTVNGTFSVLATPNYSLLAIGTVFRRTAVSLDGTNTLYFTAGIAPNDPLNDSAHIG
jgi:hypothetical protein